MSNLMFVDGFRVYSCERITLEDSLDIRFVVYMEKINSYLVEGNPFESLDDLKKRCPYLNWYKRNGYIEQYKISETIYWKE